MSHDTVIVPVLIATEAKNSFTEIIETSHNDKLTLPIKIGKIGLNDVGQPC